MLRWHGTHVFDQIRLPDNKKLRFGDANDVDIVWDGTNLIISALADDEIIEIGDSAATQLSFDLKWYANEASGASYLYFDASANLIYTVGVDLQFKDADYLVFGTGAGASGDVNITWDGTNLIITAVADDTLIEVGDSGATQKSFDLKWYANENSGASYLYFDASANLVYTTGVDLQFKDADLLVFGTGAGASGDVNITWDGTNLIVAAVADDTLIEIGDSAATQLSFDVKIYGNAANGANYLLWDASKDNLKLLVASHTVTSEEHAFDIDATGTLSSGDSYVGANVLVTVDGTAGSWVSGLYVKATQAQKSVNGYICAVEFELASVAANASDNAVVVLNSLRNHTGSPPAADPYIMLREYGTTYANCFVRVFGDTGQGALNVTDATKLVTQVPNAYEANADCAIRCMVGSTAIWLIGATTVPA